MNSPDTAVASGPSGVRIVTKPPRRFVFPDLRALWAYRDLLYFLIRRDVAVVYKQTAFGVAWVAVRPLFYALFYWAVFGWILKVPSQGIPFAAFAICGMTIYLFFSDAVTKSAASTLTNINLITKIYFPRIAVPIAAVAPAVVDLAVGLVVLEIVLLAFGITPQPEIVFVPIILLDLLVLALGAGLFLSALAARFRDVAIALGFGLQVLLFSSAVFYPLSFLPPTAQTIFKFNPLVGVMENFRAAMLPVGGIDPVQLLPSIVVGIALLIGGMFYFARAEQTMADVI